MKKLLLSILTIFIALTVVGCNNTTTTVSSNKLLVAVSIVPEATFVSEVAGDLVDIITIIPPGYSPESYDPTPKMMADLEDADVYFSIGVPTETVTILPQLSNTYVVSLDSAVRVVYEDRMFTEDSRDPHIWLSLKRVKIMVQTIATTLSSLDTANAVTYQANAADYIAQIDALIVSMQNSFDAATKDTFLVYHPAFGYLADEFGLTMISVEEEGKEATATHIQEVIDDALANDIHTIFYQSEISSEQVNSIAEEIGGTAVVLDPLSADYLANYQVMVNAILGALE